MNEMFERYASYFEIKKRGDEDIMALKESAPEDLRELVKEIHMCDSFDSLPNDWIYSIICLAFDDFPNYDCYLCCISEIEADPYYSDLKRWFSNNSFASYFCDMALEERSYKSIFEIISQGQRKAKETIYGSVLNFVQQQFENQGD